MSPEAQRIAIAEACGWTQIFKFTECDIVGFPPDEKGRREYHDSGCSPYIPDYLNDLNAIHGAVLSLPEDEQLKYYRHLARIVKVAEMESLPCVHDYRLIGNATAAQCCEAFVLALGKWDDSK